MEEEWIVFVQGKEYGPVDLQTLQEWKDEGRVLPANQARGSTSGDWIKASEIPGLFNSPVEQHNTVIASSRPPRSIAKIWRESFGIFGRGFLQFSGLTLLVIVPSVCAQLTGAAL